MVAVFLHLLLGVLRALEGEVLEPRQHPTPGVNRAHQLVGGAWKRKVEMIIRLNYKLS